MALPVGKFGPREKIWTVIFVAVVVGMTGYRTLLRPRIDAVKKAKASVVTLDNELTRLEAERPDLNTRRARLEELRKQIAQLFQELEQLEEGLLNRQDLDVLLEQVVAKRAQLQVQINAVKPLKDEPRKSAEKDRDASEAGLYKRLFVQIDSYAAFDDLIAYVKALEANSPYQRVRGVVVKIEGQDVVRPRALVMVETLLANTPEQVATRHREVFGALEQLAGRQSKDPFLALEKPKEEQIAAGLELTGVFGTGKVLTALINGNPYKVGETIQDKRIVAIYEDRVVLEQGSRRFLLYGQRGAE